MQSACQISAYAHYARTPVLQLKQRTDDFLDAVSRGDEVGGICADCSLALQCCLQRGLCTQTHIHTMLVSLAQTEKGGTHPDDAILPSF